MVMHTGSRASTGSASCPGASPRNHCRWNAGMLCQTMSPLRHTLHASSGTLRRWAMLLLKPLVCAPLLTACTPKAAHVPSGNDAGAASKPVQDHVNPHILLRGPGGHYRVQSYASGTPTALHVQLEAFPQGNAPAADLIRGCPVEILLYPADARPTKPAWRSTAAAGQPCAGAKRSADSSASTLELSFDIRHVLGDSLSPGPYRADVVVGSGQDRLRVERRGLYLWPDTLPPISSLEPLRFTVASDSEVDGRPALRVAITATNTGRRRVEIGFGACAVQVVLYQPAPGADRAVWDSRKGEACPAYSAGAILAPGESRQPQEFRSIVSFARIRGAGVPSGSYEAVATLHVGAGRNTAADSSIRLPLGTITVP